MTLKYRVPIDPAQAMLRAVFQELAAQEITVEVVAPEDEKRWDKLVRKHHYLKEHRLVGECVRYVVRQKGRWIALLGWSSAAYHLDDRDRWIGWSPAQRQARRHLVACNARFLMLCAPNTSPQLASQILSLNVRRLSADWQERYGHPILLAETFVDPTRFEARCYQAANWIEIGRTKGFARSHLDFYQLHAQAKTIFLYPVHPQGRELLAAPVWPAELEAFQRLANPRQFPLSRQQTQSLLQALEALPDPRRRCGWRHRHIASIVAIATAGMIAGNHSLLAIGQFAASLSQEHLRRLGAARCRRTGQYVAPSETTIRRVLQRLDPEALDRIVNTWMRSHLESLDIAALAVDGKCARTASKLQGQSVQLFSALDLQTRIVCRQIQIPSKTNEIPSLKDLLDQLDLRGTLVSADALHTQKATATHLVEVKGADYLLPVKANQPKLWAKLARLAQAPTGVFFPSGPHAAPSPRSP